MQPNQSSLVALSGQELSSAFTDGAEDYTGFAIGLCTSFLGMLLIFALVRYIFTKL